MSIPPSGAGWFRLHDALLANRGLQTIVDTAAELLGNPCYVGDARFKVLAMTRVVGTDDPVWRGMQEHGYASLEQMRELDEAGVSDRVRVGHGVQRVEFASSRYPWVNMAVGDDLAHVAFFGCIEQNGPLDAERLELFAYAARVVACELRNARYESDSLRSAREHFLFEAATGRLEDPSQSLDLMSRARMRDEHPYRIIIVRNTQEDPRIPEAVRYQLENVSHATCAAIIQEDLVLLLSGRRVEAFARDRHARFERSVAEAGMIAGSSTDFEDILDAAPRCREAKVTLDLNEGLGIAVPLLTYDDPRVYPFSAVMAGHFSLASFVHPHLKAIEDYDRRKGTELVATLDAYMRNNYNVAQTARDFFTHRNTIDYRLRRIEELMGASLSDPNVNMALWLSLQARRLMAHEERTQDA